MPDFGKKWFGVAPLFDPKDGATIITPNGGGRGNWVGGLSALHDKGTFYLFYRERRPIGEGRGWRCHIAESTDGLSFTTAWIATKEDLNAESIEAGALVKSLDGKLRLYVSYVDLDDRRWKIAMIEGETPADFSASKRIVVLTGDEADSEGVKDPYVAIVGGRYYMFIHYAPRSLQPIGATEEELHGTGNIFATGKGRGSSGLAVSNDGIHFDWVGDVVPPGDGWDEKLTRVDTMVYIPPVFTVFYSARPNVDVTYEDNTGVAVSLDLVNFHKLTPDEPALVSPWGTGALRYMDAVQLGDEIWYYYECSREDEAHEIRLNRAKVPS